MPQRPHLSSGDSGTFSGGLSVRERDLDVGALPEVEILKSGEIVLLSPKPDRRGTLNFVLRVSCLVSRRRTLTGDGASYLRPGQLSGEVGPAPALGPAVMREERSGGGAGSARGLQGQGPAGAQEGLKAAGGRPCEVGRPAPRAGRWARQRPLRP